MPPGSGRLLTGLARRRILVFGGGALVGVIVYFIVPTWLHGATRFIAAYDAAVLVVLTGLRSAFHSDPNLTRARAGRDDPGRNYILLLVLATVVVGLLAAIAIFGRGPNVHNGVERWEAYILGVIAVASGWFLVHTAYTLRYAHLFYYDDSRDSSVCGGIRFPGTDHPNDFDFAYFSFTLGTSFAVSDPQVTETRVRGEVILHSIISFAHNSLIVGLVINLFAGIFSSLGSGK